jgi:short-subunit dehydrogenase
MLETKMMYAMITGASKGIGKSMAVALARRKINLLLIARSADELNTLQTNIKNQYGVEVYSLAIDLSHIEAPKAVLNWII